MSDDDAAPPSDPSSELVVARVQRADCAENVVLLEVRVPGRTSFVILGAPRSAGGRAAAGLLPRDDRQAIWGARLPPASTRVKAREEALLGARILALGDADATIEQKGDLRVVRAHGGRVAITDVEPGREGKSLRHDLVEADDARRAQWEERGIALARALANDAIEVHRAELLRMLEKATTKIDRRREAIRADIAKIAQADKIAEQAQWLVAEAARTPRGATKMVVTDWSSGEAVPMEIPLDPAKGAREQVEAMFKRAKRLRLGGRIAGERLANADVQAKAIDTAREAVTVAESLVAMDDAVREAKRIAPKDVTVGTPAPATATKKEKKGEARRTPFRTFLARSGKKLLVGKGAADNDALTLHVAKPHDLWLHAKDRTGAHVIVPLEKGHSCTPDDLVDAAHLAAHFSDARDEKIVDVQYTPKRFLRKPKGSGPGFVIVDREKVLALRKEAAILGPLLEREEVS